MTIRYLNITIGLLQTIICSLVIIPITVSVIRTGGGGFGFGLMFLPVGVPLSLAALFGLFGLFDYQRNYERTKKLLIATHALTAIAGIISFIVMPIFPFLIIAIPLAFMLVVTMTKENIGLKILITNGLLLICLLGFLYIWISESNETIMESITRIW